MGKHPISFRLSFFLSNVFVARDLADHDSYMIRPSVYKRVINYLPARLFNFLVLLVFEKGVFRQNEARENE